MRMISLTTATLIIISVTLNAQSKPANTTTLMENQNKAIIQNLYEQALNKRNFELLNTLISPDYAGPRGTSGVEAFIPPIKALLAAFPNLQWKLQELIAEGHQVFVWWKVEGTHTATFQGIAATGKTVCSDGMAVYTLSGERIVRGQVFTDRFNFLQQLGILPADITSRPQQTASPEHVQFIDTFIIPAAAREAFLERVKINRTFISTLPGFINDTAYERTDDHGNVHYITIATWQNDLALKQAKDAVQAEYKRQAFDPTTFLANLHITMTRDIYKSSSDL